jgi:hypothetical protein
MGIGSRYVQRRRVTLSKMDISLLNICVEICSMVELIHGALISISHGQTLEECEPGANSALCWQ